MSIILLQGLINGLHIIWPFTGNGSLMQSTICWVILYTILRDPLTKAEVNLWESNWGERNSVTKLTQSSFPGLFHGKSVISECWLCRYLDCQAAFSIIHTFPVQIRLVKAQFLIVILIFRRRFSAIVLCLFYVYCTFKFNFGWASLSCWAVLSAL